MCVSLCPTVIHNTAQNSSDDPLILQTIIITQMMSTGREGVLISLKSEHTAQSIQYERLQKNYHETKQWWQWLWQWCQCQCTWQSVTPTVTGTVFAPRTTRPYGISYHSSVQTPVSSFHCVEPLLFHTALHLMSPHDKGISLHSVWEKSACDQQYSAYCLMIGSTGLTMKQSDVRTRCSMSALRGKNKNNSGSDVCAWMHRGRGVILHTQV